MYKTLLQEATQLDVGIGKANTKIIQAHLQFHTNNKEKDQKMVETLLHAINHCTGRYLEPKHLEWRNKATSKPPSHP